MSTKNRVKRYEQEIIKTLSELVAFDSVKTLPTEDAPFGIVNKECLHKALELCQKHGLTPHNLDNYIGYGEVGSGDEVIGVLGHLDIVPAGEGWDSDPFTLTERDGKLFGRGTSDDKGAVVASLFALQVLQDEGYQFPKRVRLIMGCDEESGSSCLKHYVEREGHFQYGFTPDALFPGVFGEKGSLGAIISYDSSIIDIKGGVAPNVVCDHCITMVEKNSLDVDRFQQALIEKNIKFNITKKEDIIILDVQGVAAHASTPENGINAISFTMEALHKAGFDDPFVNLYNKLIGLKNNGSLCGINLSDQYGSLTLNIGVIKKEGSKINASVDIRVPITLNSNDIAKKMSEAFSIYPDSLSIIRVGPSLFYPTDSPLVKSLVAAYRQVTHDYTSTPTTMGGGTYAKGINNCIAFGGEFQNEENCHMHDANEFIKIENLLLQVEIYVQAIKNLCQL
ncbi:MAG: Sapep family Mn(2+)-dependent dipeptidase [Erysipelotrichaceae bacterium]|nr:Sapep family Mn(2+)-dependent dipeptidase [Erysipelotrichaceae bacterium]